MNALLRPCWCVPVSCGVVSLIETGNVYGNTSGGGCISHDGRKRCVEVLLQPSDADLVCPHFSVFVFSAYTHTRARTCTHVRNTLTESRMYPTAPVCSYSPCCLWLQTGTTFDLHQHQFVNMSKSVSLATCVLRDRCVVLLSSSINRCIVIVRLQRHGGRRAHRPHLWDQ